MFMKVIIICHQRLVSPMINTSTGISIICILIMVVMMMMINVIIVIVVVIIIFYYYYYYYYYCDETTFGKLSQLDRGPSPHPSKEGQPGESPSLNRTP